MQRWVVGLCSLVGALSGSCENPRHAYFSVRGDVRLCAAPLCGGFFFKQLNASRTRCFDGSEQPECYAGQLDFSSMNLTYPQIQAARTAALRGHGVLRGELVRGPGATGDLAPSFFVSEVWQAQVNQSPADAFYLARDEGITCVTYPCDHISAKTLNDPSSATRLFAGLEVPPFGSLPPEAAAKLAANLREGGVIVSGQAVPISGPAGASATLVASEYYLRVLRDPNTCFPGVLPCTQEEGEAWRQAYMEMDALRRASSACSADADCTLVGLRYPFGGCGGDAVNKASASQLVERARELSLAIGAADLISDCPNAALRAECVDSRCERITE